MHVSCTGSGGLAGEVVARPSRKEAWALETICLPSQLLFWVTLAVPIPIQPPLISAVRRDSDNAEELLRDCADMTKLQSMFFNHMFKEEPSNRGSGRFNSLRRKVQELSRSRRTESFQKL